MGALRPDHRCFISVLKPNVQTFTIIALDCGHFVHVVLVRFKEKGQDN